MKVRYTGKIPGLPRDACSSDYDGTTILSASVTPGAAPGLIRVRGCIPVIAWFWAHSGEDPPEADWPCTVTTRAWYNPFRWLYGKVTREWVSQPYAKPAIPWEGELPCNAVLLLDLDKT